MAAFMYNFSADDARRLKQQLSSKCITAEGGSCHLWTGAENNGYGRMKITYDLADGTRTTKVLYAHVLAFVLNEREGSGGEELEGYDVSHLCGVRRCINPAHLWLEPRKTNEERKKCHRSKLCEGHGDYPPCLV